MKDLKKYQLSLFFVIASFAANAQNGSTSITLPWGIRDTIFMPVVNYNGEFLPYRELDNVYVSKLSPEQLAEAIAAYNRLRNAVYATYGYARTAGYTLNDVAANLAGKSKSQRKAYIKSREKELKKEFSDPLTNLTVYQGKVLMKLISRQTGNNCYEIVKEHRGSLNARMYQTVAFFFGGNLRQDYDHINDNTDRQIENIVKEIDGVWYNNPSRPLVSGR
jgi:benzoyl-CoA reductase/2-hydroxyglutaryl-CoA dehydratase subunit BcrC/BadD/HgdB